jgi:hypothetical protein
MAKILRSRSFSELSTPSNSWKANTNILTWSDNNYKNQDFSHVGCKLLRFLIADFWSFWAWTFMIKNQQLETLTIYSQREKNPGFCNYCRIKSKYLYSLFNCWTEYSAQRSFDFSKFLPSRFRFHLIPETFHSRVILLGTSRNV